ncbi:MAG: rhomboid family intramembrane serine protease [Myxococcales bacterium]|nr:rhomboid family intramembrane serine protease [Myxococcales bacterium]
MLLRLVRDFRRAMDLSLVLDQEKIEHQLRSVGEEQWALTIGDEADAERAEKALIAFERENPPVASRKPQAPLSDGIGAGVVFGLALLALQIWTGPESDNAWFVRGSAEASQIVRGEWWRAITALTLHADAGHAVGNALLGGLLLTLLARRLGSGVASAAMLLAGMLGTFAAAELMRRHFVSVGASTAVFGGLAELAALQAADPESRRRAWIPLGAGVALLGFLGSSKRADLAGHLCGFAAGVAIGFAVSRLPRLRSKAAQSALACAAACTPVIAWLRALLVN